MRWQSLSRFLSKKMIASARDLNSSKPVNKKRCQQPINPPPRAKELLEDMVKLSLADLILGKSVTEEVHLNRVAIEIFWTS